MLFTAQHLLIQIYFLTVRLYGFSCTGVYVPWGIPYDLFEERLALPTLSLFHSFNTKVRVGP